jgi:hypothetical protein
MSALVTRLIYTAGTEICPCCSSARYPGIDGQPEEGLSSFNDSCRSPLEGLLQPMSLPFVPYLILYARGYLGVIDVIVGSGHHIPDATRTKGINLSADLSFMNFGWQTSTCSRRVRIYGIVAAETRRHPLLLL